MPEEIFNHKGPIAVIPPAQVMLGRINEMQRKINRTRKEETRQLLETELAKLQAAYQEIRRQQSV